MGRLACDRATKPMMTIRAGRKSANDAHACESEPRTADLFDGCNNSALAFALQPVPCRDRRFTRWVRPDAHAPKRALAGLQRLCICGVTGALQASDQRVRALVVGEGGKLHCETVVSFGPGLAHRCARGRGGCCRRHLRLRVGRLVCSQRFGTFDVSARLAAVHTLLRCRSARRLLRRGHCSRR